MAAIKTISSGNKHLEEVIAQVTHPGMAAGENTKTLPICAMPYNVELVQVAIINENAVTGDNTNRYNMNLIDGGAEGAGTTEIANRDLATGTDLPAGKTLLFDATTSSPQSDGEVFMSQGDILSLEMEEVGTGPAIEPFVVLVMARSANLAS